LKLHHLQQQSVHHLIYWSQWESNLMHHYV
jgi:hypothetical protein